MSSMAGTVARFSGTPFAEEKPTENEALIESSFRRLISAIEAEREKLRCTWRHVEEERDNSAAELERLRHDTEEWCYGERQKIESEWTRLDTLQERLSVVYPDVPEKLHINCSGQIFEIQKSALCTIEGSYLNNIFSDAFIQNIPLDSEGRFFLDFNPTCFGYICDFLERRQRDTNAQPPPIPAEQQHNMDTLAVSLLLKPFLPHNVIPYDHGTSLRVTGQVIEATHPGWQIIAAQFPLLTLGCPGFEVKILANNDTKGGLAIGVCGHKPTPAELHSIRLPDSIMYNSNTGIIGDVFAAENVTRGIQLAAGQVLGLRHNVAGNSLEWSLNHMSIGASSIKASCLERMRTLFPVFALYSAHQRIEVELNIGGIQGLDGDDDI